MSLGKMGALLKADKLAGTHSSAATRHYLDTGYPPLNEIISGHHHKGLPSGQLVMIGGPSACGKTMISTQLMISAQQQGGYAAFFDYERQYQMPLAEKQGLLTDDDHFQYYKPRTFEEGIAKAIKLGELIRDNKVIPEDAPIVMVFDSVHAMTPQSKFDNLLGKKGAVEGENRATMHDNYALSAAWGAWSATVSSEFDRLGITGIFLNQVRVKLDGHGNVQYTFPGGDTLYFYCSTVLVLTAQDIYNKEKGDPKKLVKKDIKVLTRKSRSTRPHQIVHYDFVFAADNTGSFDVITSYVSHLMKIEAIKTGGAGWCEFDGKKIQGADKVGDYFRSLPDGIEQLIALHDKHLAAAS